MDIPLSRSDYFREIAKEARIRTRNRYFEQNPVLTEQQSATIARMGLKRFLQIGDGPIRGVYSQPGSFSDALFVASGDQLFRVDGLVVTLIGTLPSGDLTASVSMAATANIGETPEYLFVACGSTLMCYVENGFARGNISGVPANTNVVRVGSVYYSFTNGSVNAGAPAGTLANPWLVALGASASDAWANLAAAFGASGAAGTQYSTALTANTEIVLETFTSTTVYIRAVAVGIAGNGVVTTETGAAIAWTAGTLTGGGTPTWFPIEAPDDVGIIAVAYVASYVVCVPAQDQGINGQFFWIDPGETTIDPLDFATAERAPDPISGAVVFGDQFWLPGSNTTEVWYFTGNEEAPVLRLQGIVFDRGAWEGTAVQVKESMIIVDNEGEVFQTQSGGGLKKISRPDVTERIRGAIQFQALQAAL